MTLLVRLPCHTTGSTSCSPRVPIAGHCWRSDCTLRRSDRASDRGWWSDREPKRSEAAPVIETTPRTEAGSRTTTTGGPTAHPHMVPSLAASPTSVMPHVVPTISIAPTQHPRLLLRHAGPRHARLHPRLPWHQCPNTTRVTLGLCGSYRHHLYIGSCCRRRPYRWHLRSTLIR
jgi:hypothetical protein